MLTESDDFDQTKFIRPGMELNLQLPHVEGAFYHYATQPCS